MGQSVILCREVLDQPLRKSRKRITAEVAHLVEHNLAKVRVAGSSPVFRSKIPNQFGIFFKSVYRRLGGGTGRHAGLRPVLWN